MDAKHETLGDNVIPVNYKLLIESNFKTFKFNGEVEIEINIKNSTKVILINSKDLEIKEAQIKVKNDVLNATVKPEKNEKISLSFGKKVIGNASLIIKYIGTNNEQMYGFYRSRYVNKGKESSILSSQFEASSARAAFPCFDEPAFKATFELSLIVDHNLDAISNMPIKAIKRAKNKKNIVFFKTPKMSTYLLYLGVGKYEYLEDKLGKLKLRVITVPGRKKLTGTAMEYAKKCIAFYEDYFGIKFPLPKMDFIAIPDFASGAMENWGAIAFKEVEILLDPKNAPILEKERAAEVIAHEIAHQWFGNLVTMEWWDDLWLNESFATYMSFKLMKKVFPEWKMEIQEDPVFNHNMAGAFVADGLKNTHPINVKVSTPADISQVFDEISYDKGACILYMLEDYVGKEIFKSGLNIYLNEHAYGNAKRNDLWNAIQKSSSAQGNEVNIVKFLEPWIEKPGYPIVDAVNATDGIHISQKRFTLSRDIKDKWPIPLSYLSDSESDKFLFDKEKYIIEKNFEWIKINAGQTGFYRSRYDQKTLQRLGLLIKAKKLGGNDIWGIGEDLFVLSRSGREKIEVYLNFINDYMIDCDYPANLNVLSHLYWFKGICFGTKKEKEIKNTMDIFGKNVINKIGIQKREQDSNVDAFIRSSAIGLLGRLGNEKVVSYVNNLFSDFLSGKEINPDLKKIVIGLSAWYGDSKTFKILMERYEKAEMPQDKLMFLISLGMFRDPEILKQMLDFSMTSGVTLQYSYVLPAIISGNDEGKKIIWQWTRKNWKKLMEMHAVGTKMLDRYIDNMSLVSDEKTYNEIKDFFSKKDNIRGDMTDALAQVLERIEANMKFMKENSLQ